MSVCCLCNVSCPRSLRDCDNLGTLDTCRVVTWVDDHSHRRGRKSDSSCDWWLGEGPGVPSSFVDYSAGSTHRRYSFCGRGCGIGDPSLLILQAILSTASPLTLLKMAFLFPFAVITKTATFPAWNRETSYGFISGQTLLVPCLVDGRRSGLIGKDSDRACRLSCFGYCDPLGSVCN